MKRVTTVRKHNIPPQYIIDLNLLIYAIMYIASNKFQMKIKIRKDEPFVLIN